MSLTIKIPTKWALPDHRTLIRALGATSDNKEEVTSAAAALAAQHLLRRQARSGVTDMDAGDHVVAAAARAIAMTDTARAVLIAGIDLWASRNVVRRQDARLHTESLGRLIDRIAESWAGWQQLTDSDEDHLAVVQLSELCTAYDDLVDDLHTGRRQLPVHQTPRCGPDWTRGI